LPSGNKWVPTIPLVSVRSIGSESFNGSKRGTRDAWIERERVFCGIPVRTHYRRRKARNMRGGNSPQIGFVRHAASPAATRGCAHEASEGESDNLTLVGAVRTRNASERGRPDRRFHRYDSVACYPPRIHALTMRRLSGKPG